MSHVTPLTQLRAGHAAAAARKRQLERAEGPQPERAVAQAQAAIESLAAMGRFPGPRDPISERAVEVVRARWVEIQRRAQASREE